MGEKNFCAIKMDQNSKSKKHIAKMKNALGGAKIDEILDRTPHANHDPERQKDNIYLYINEEICGEFDYENKCVKDKNFNSDLALKNYIKATDYYSTKDKYGRTHKLSDENIVCREFYFWFSPDQKERMEGQLDKWAKANLKFIKDQFPEFTIVCAVVHKHETTPHMQILVIPFDEKGKLNNYKYFYDDQDNELKKSKKKINGQRTAQQLQTEYANVVGSQFGLVRGEMGNKERMDYEQYKAEKEIENIKAKAEVKIEQVKAEAEIELERVEINKQAKIDSAKKRADEEIQVVLEEINIDMDTKIKEFLIDSNNEQLAIKKQKQKQMQELREQSNEEVKQLKKIHEEEINKLKKQLETEKNELENQLDEFLNQQEQFNDIDDSYADYMKNNINTDLNNLTVDDYLHVLEENKKMYSFVNQMKQFLDVIFKELEQNLSIFKPFENLSIKDQIQSFIEQLKQVKYIFQAGLRTRGLDENRQPIKQNNYNFDTVSNKDEHERER